MTNQKITFVTNDLALTAALSLFYPIEEVDRTNPRKAQFLFCRDAELDKLVDEFWKGEMRVDPQQFFNQLRVVKARLYGEE